jgi:hypothetical protein
MDKSQSGTGSASTRQDEKQDAPSAPAWTRQQWDRLAQVARMEIMHHPGYKSWSPEQRAQEEAKHLQKISAMPHYQNMVAFKQRAPSQSPVQESREPSKPVAESGETSERQKEEEPKPETRSFDRNEWLGLSPTQILQKLVKTGLVKDTTNPGSGLEIVGTSQRRPH